MQRCNVPPSAPQPAAGTSSSGVAARLQGISCITISLPGTIFQETSAGALEDSATILPGLDSLLAELVRRADLYALVHVESDVGEATASGALEHAGLLGSGPGQLPPHRLLFCSTREGKASMVRQLEPGLHIDGDAETVQQLQRFVPRLVLIGRGPTPAGANIRHELDLQTVLGWSSGAV